jgi:hypothetical protein
VALFGVSLGLLGQQSGTGTITGAVTDTSGALIPQVKIAMRNVGTGIVTLATTGSEGVFTIPFLQVGTYELSVTKEGFQKYVQAGIALPIGATLTVNVELKVGQAVQEVEVKSSAPLLKSATSDISTAIDNRSYESLPLDVSGGRRDPTAFMFLAPGTTGSTFSAQVNGGESFSNELWIEGAPVGLGGLNASVRPAQWATSVDAVDEFKLTTNNPSADLGRAAGVMHLEYKAGTNSLHGEAYEFLRNNVFDARGFFPSTVPRDRENEFGFNVGGPIIIPKVYNGHDKTFFFFDYNAYRNRPGAPGSRVTVPTPQELAGNFQGVAKIYDPATTRTLPDGTVVRDEFQCNGQLDIICPNRFSAISSNFFPLIPKPDFPGTVNNYQARYPGSPQTNNRDITLRLDHRISDKQNVTFSYAGGPVYSTIAGTTNGLLGALEDYQPLQAYETVVRLSHTYTLRPNLLNHLTLGFNRDDTFNPDPQFGQNWPAKLGFKGLVQNNTMVSVEFESGGFANWHTYLNTEAFGEINNTWTIEEQLDWIHGKHNVKFGADIRRLGDNIFGNGAPGDFMFNSTETGSPGVPGTGNSFASFLLGATDVAAQDINAFGTTGDRWRYLAGFVQDDFKATPRLTLNLGLRYEIPFTHTEVYNRLSTLDPNLPNPGAGNYPGALTYAGFGAGRCNCTRLTNLDYREFGPRFGLAYQINAKTVFRGGYGLYYVSGGDVGGNAERGFPIGWAVSPVVFSPDGGTTPAFSWDSTFPLPPGFVPPPDLTPQFANGSAVNWTIRQQGQAPYYQNWNVNLEREISPNLLISAAYVGTKGTRLPTGLYNPNQVNSKYLSLGNLLGADISSPQAQAAIAAGTIPPVPYPGFTGTVAQSLRQFPQYAGVNVTNDLSGNSTYNALQIKVEKRYSQGLQFLVSYTGSKTIDDAGSLLGGFYGSSGRDQFNRKIEKSLSVNDIPQNLVVSYTYELPFGPGKKYVSHGGAVGRVTGGWKVSGVSRYFSGTPIGMVVNDTLNLFNEQNNPNRVPGVKPRSNISLSNFDVLGGQDSYVNLAAFSDPASFTFGNAPRTLGDLRQPAFYNEDFGIMKRTDINERVNIEFRAEAFNLFNRVVFSLPSPENFDSPSAVGKIANQADVRREIQLALKINF